MIRMHFNNNNNNNNDNNNNKKSLKFMAKIGPYI